MNKKFLEKVNEIQDMKKEINLVKDGQRELFELLKPLKEFLLLLEKD
jgi:hypothetical protein